MENKLISLKKYVLDCFSGINTAEILNEFYLKIFGKKGEFNQLIKDLKTINVQDRARIGKLANSTKKELDDAFLIKKKEVQKQSNLPEIDVTAPGIEPKLGHLHLVTTAIREISAIFEKIGFTRVRYSEVEWDWFSFESLNFPDFHPARDDVETFFIKAPSSPEYGRMLLSPHTSSGQVREMLKTGTPPIRMINIAKCYRPNWDISHTPMFHQFEGLVIDENINITHLKGTFEYFARMFFGPDRKIRLRPFHFQFTEPSFEVDITCDICHGKGCRLCKEGWLELGGSGMVHPNVLRAGKIDPAKYTGYAFGWGVERTYMMKQGLKIDDLRLMYGNDIRFLEQF